MIHPEKDLEEMTVAERSALASSGQLPKPEKPKPEAAKATGPTPIPD